MAELIPMLALSPTMEEGVIVKWIKKEGEAVAAGEVLCEVETDKAVMDYEASTEGTLLKILVAEGEGAPVGESIAIMGEQGEDVSALEAQAGAQRRTPLKKAPKPEGPPAEQKPHAPAMAQPPRPPEEEFPGAKGATAAPPRKAEQPPSQRPAWPAPGVPVPARASAPAEQAPAPIGRAPTGGVMASPLARKLATDAGLDLRNIRGSGPEGRIVKRDIEQALQGAPPPRPEEAKEQAPPARAPAGAAPTDQAQPISTKRRIIAQRLSESAFTAPHYYLTAAVRMDAILAARKQLNDTLQSKVSLNAFLIKFVAQTLAGHPMINASWQADTIVTHGSADIALAVALPEGLLAPIVRNCAGKGILMIDEELADLVERAKSGKLKPEEFTGATFTISNLGNFGMESFTAIINPPGSAILAVGQIQRQPVVAEGDKLEIHSMMRLTLSCDHRVIDGAVGAAFLKDLKEMMENPVRALL